MRRNASAGPKAGHLLAAVVLVLVAAVALTTSLALRGVVRSQEHRLLDERAIEVAGYLKAATAQTTSALLTAAESVAFEGPRTALFASVAGPLTLGGATVGVAQATSGAFTTVAVLGKRETVGEPVDADLARIVGRAVRSDGLVFNVLPGAAGSRIVEAIRAPGARTPTVAFLDSLLPPVRPTQPKSDSPYRELNAVLYAGTSPDPKRIVLIQNSMPTSNSTRQLIPVGADSALLVISARGPLVGSFAVSVPWIVLAGGLALAVLLAVLVAVLSRRRAYALNLVEQRTREMYEAQLTAEAANRSKSEFLSRMSHELRTPLNAVLGFSQLLELDELTPDQEQAVSQITKGGRHLLDLINEILDITQIETGTLALSPEAVNIAEVVGETVALVRPLAAERGVRLLARETAACDRYVFVDRQRMKQILLNLLGNGIKYNREGGSVSISCAEAAPGRLRVQVTDTGPGIPKEQVGLLFTPFERLGAERTTVEGTGIGLALSRRLAAVMGGTLGVESTVGRGSTFTVEFPVLDGSADPAERVRTGVGPEGGR